MLIAAPSQALTMPCAAQIGQIAILPNGTVSVQYGDMGYFFLCNLNTNHSTSVGMITPETCKGMLSITMTAKATGAQIYMSVDFGASPIPGCVPGALGSWAVPNPFPYYWSIYP